MNVVLVKLIVCVLMSIHVGRATTVKPEVNNSCPQLKGDRGEFGHPGSPGVRGHKGDQGPPGKVGIKGDKGERGPTGPGGSTGLSGAPGVIGKAGLQGRVGEQGPPGNTGIQGPVGPRGPPGETGSKGIKGEEGPRGNRGVPGLDGTHGPPGHSGRTGSRGMKGNKGSAGIAGHKGEQGRQGIPGTVVDEASLEEYLAKKIDARFTTLTQRLNMNNNRPAAHMYGHGSIGTRLTWTTGGYGGFLDHGMKYDNGYLIVPRQGLYYIYVQVICNPKSSSWCGFSFRINDSNISEQHISQADSGQDILSYNANEAGLLRKLNKDDRISVTKRSSDQSFAQTYQTYIGCYAV